MTSSVLLSPCPLSLIAGWAPSSPLGDGPLALTQRDDLQPARCQLALTTSQAGHGHAAPFARNQTGILAARHETSLQGSSRGHVRTFDVSSAVDFNTLPTAFETMPSLVYLVLGELEQVVVDVGARAEHKDERGQVRRVL